MSIVHLINFLPHLNRLSFKQCWCLFSNLSQCVQVEEESKQMVDTFLTTGDNIDKFLKGYQEKRTLVHIRRVKVMISISSLLEKYHEKRKLISVTRLLSHWSPFFRRWTKWNTWSGDETSSNNVRELVQRMLQLLHLHQVGFYQWQGIWLKMILVGKYL